MCLRVSTCTARAPRAHRIGYLNNSPRKWLAFGALVTTIPWWRLLGEELLFILAGCEGPLGRVHIETKGQNVATNKSAKKKTLQRTWDNKKKGAAHAHEPFWASNWKQQPLNWLKTPTICTVRAPHGHHACAASDTPPQQCQTHPTCKSTHGTKSGLSVQNCRRRAVRQQVQQYSLLKYPPLRAVEWRKDGLRIALSPKWQPIMWHNLRPEPWRDLRSQQLSTPPPE